MNTEVLVILGTALGAECIQQTLVRMHVLGEVVARSAIYYSRDRTGGARFYWNVGLRIQTGFHTAELQHTIQRLQSSPQPSVSKERWVDIDIIFHAGQCLRPAEMEYDYVRVILGDLGYRFDCSFDRVLGLDVRLRSG